jgi:hypothetical protein
MSGSRGRGGPEADRAWRQEGSYANHYITCRAAPGMLCTTRRGGIATKPHSVRARPPECPIDSLEVNVDQLDRTPRSYENAMVGCPWGCRSERDCVGHRIYR